MAEKPVTERALRLISLAIVCGVDSFDVEECCIRHGLSYDTSPLEEIRRAVLEDFGVPVLVPPKMCARRTNSSEYASYGTVTMDDYEIEDGPCPHCGNSILHFKHCDVIGCEDGYIDEYEDDPINYAPGEELRECEECHGTGILRWCPACGKDVVLEPPHEFMPCPFCGSENIDEDEDFGMLFCRACGYGMSYEGCETEEQRAEVRRQWNTRPLEDALSKEAERLRGLLRSFLDRIGRFLAEPDRPGTGDLIIMATEIESALKELA